MSPPNPAVLQRVAATVAVLVIAAAALLIVGIILERNGESATPRSDLATSESHDGRGESAEGHHAEDAAAVDEIRTEATDHRAGFDVESPWIVALGSVVAVTLAVAVWRRPSRSVIVIVGLFTAAESVLDLLEVRHLVTEGRTNLALLAGLLVALRLATLAGCGYLYRPTTVAV